MFRMHRDVRFSKDKSPYKTSVGGLLTPSGTKKESQGLCYLHLAVGGGFVATGFYRLATDHLVQIRRRIAADPQAFGEVMEGLRRTGRTLSREDSLKRMPRGFEDQADRPFADALKLKSFIVSENLSEAAWLDGDVVRRAARLVGDTAPLLTFGDRAAPA